MERRMQLWRAALILVVVLLSTFILPFFRHRPIALADSSTKVQRAASSFHFEYDDFCDTRFNSGGWVGIPNVSCDLTTRSVATCGPSHSDNWQWSSDAVRCGAERLHAADLHRSLSGRWLVVAGDSIARFFFAALLRLASDDPSQQIVYGHRDFEYMLPNNIKATFKWVPYIKNVTDLFSNWTRLEETPDAIVLSAGLWHMLHIDDAVNYAHQLQILKQAANDFARRPQVAPGPPMSFFSISEVYPPKLKTEEKRLHLTYNNVDKYNEAIQDSGLLVPKGPCYLIDLHHLTQGCGPTCTHDGLHYSNATYDAALQIWAANMLSILKSP